MKRIFHLFAVVLAVMSLSLMASGCGTAQETAGGQTDAKAQEETGSKEASGAKEKYIVGTDAAFAPFEYINEKGEVVGWDIEFIQALADAVGFEVEVKHTGWDPIFTGALDNGEIDMAVAGITITEERKQSFDFSDPYFVAHQLILVP